MNFYQNLIGAKVSSFRTTLTIVAAWQHNTGVRVMGVARDGESFLVDLPDTGWTLSITDHNV
jgi:hypothetical protein